MTSSCFQSLTRLLLLFCLVNILHLSLVLRDVENIIVTPTTARPQTISNNHYAPPITGLRLLYCIVSSSSIRLDTLEILLDNSIEWCHGGAKEVAVVLDTFDESYETALRPNYRICSNGGSWRLHVYVHNETTHIDSMHRKHFADRLDDHDVFIYSEDDMSVRFKTLNRWYYETAIMSLTQRRTYNIGFWRYENTFPLLQKKAVRKKVRIMKPDFFSLQESFGSSRLANRVVWEHNMSAYHLIGIDGEKGVESPQLNFMSTIFPLPYAAAYALLPDQVMHLEQRCLYLSRQGGPDQKQLIGREFSGGQQLYHCPTLAMQFHEYNLTRFLSTYDRSLKQLSCCMRFLMPIENFEDLMIHHIGTSGKSKDTKWANRHRIPLARFIPEWYEWIKNQTQKEDNMKMGITN